MQRHLSSKLEQWKKSPRRKPLLLLGARQVGKTWLMRDFGASQYKQVAYIRFDRNERMRQVFSESSYDMKELLLNIQMQVGFKITPEDTLIVLDEIQECPAALTSLKYFCEDLPEYHVMAAGSLLGVQLHEGTGFPVGKVNTLVLYPMSYREFLIAMGHELDAELLAQGDWGRIRLFADRFAYLLRLYYYVGGMPEAVSTFVETHDFSAVRDVQNEILSHYANDFSKHVPKSLASKLSLLWESVPHQLARENKRFMYKDVQKGMRSRDLEDAMDWLRRAGLIHLVYRVNASALPLSAYRDGAFKIYMLDVGLLGAKSGLSASVLTDKSAVFREFKGALAEQFVQQQLRAECGIEPHYWQNDSARSEIDFVFQSDRDVVPVEVKAETNTKAKSLLLYCRQFQPRIAVRCSMNDYSCQPLPYGINTTLVDLPLYAVSQMNQVTQE